MSHLWLFFFWEEFINFLTHEIELAYGFSFEEQLQSESLARIVSDSHFLRLQGYIDENKDKIIYGGQYDRDDKFISPTIMDVEGQDHHVIYEEIFGPIIPIASYSSSQDLEQLLKEIESPLAIYIFSN